MVDNKSALSALKPFFKRKTKIKTAFFTYGRMHLRWSKLDRGTTL